MFNITKSGDLNIERRFSLLKDILNGDLVGELGDLAQEHFLEGFPKTSGARGGGKTDASRGGWTRRETNPGWPTLNHTGDLKNSIRVTKRKRYSIVYSNNSYGRYHNDGTSRLPKREFIGRSKSLNLKSRKYITKQMDSILKSSTPYISKFR